jgi:hypothetical protein
MELPQPDGHVIAGRGQSETATRRRSSAHPDH